MSFQSTLMITFDVWSTGKPLDLEVLIDSESVYSQTITTKTPVSIELNDDEERTVSLEIIMKNKSTDHVVVGDSGEIIKDSMLKFSNIEIDKINIEKIIWSQAKYTHDFNGSGNLIIENFYGLMGCNGVVKLDISTPIYQWLLEKI